MSVAVLGRGQSLQYYRDFSSKFNKIYIVNHFDKEIDLLGVEHFRNKKAVHVQFNKHTQLSDSHRRLFCDFQTQVNSKNDLPETMKKRGYPLSIPWKDILKHSKRFDTHKKLIKFLEEEYQEQILYHRSHKRYAKASLRMWPTSGMLAIELALVENDPVKLYLFGFDFYEQGYFIPKKFQLNEERTEMMRYHLQQLRQEFATSSVYHIRTCKLSN